MMILDPLNMLIDRAALRRRLLALPMLAQRRRQAIAGRQAAFEPPELTSAGRAVVEAIREKAIHTGMIADLLNSDADVIGQLEGGAVDQLLDGLGKDLLESDEILRLLPAVYMLGLTPTMLGMAELYLAEHCYYLGVSIKRERVSSSEVGTRQWHADIEDDRIFRFMVYLSDVDEGSGPFNYVPAGQSTAARAAMGYRSGYIPDALLSKLMPPASAKAVIGNFGTFVAFDGARLLHRAGRPTTRNRLSLTLIYCSRYPRQIYRPGRLRRPTRQALMPTLDERQQACIPQARWS